ncbi:MAG: hypothetical protein Kow0092_35670 [Deferrisomatales bacterium]
MAPSPRTLLPRRTTVRDLTLAIIATVVVVMSSVGLIDYARSTARIQRELDAQAEDMADKLAGVLAAPLWNLDRTSVELVGRAYIHTPNVASLTISDDLGEVLFRSGRPVGPQAIAVRRAVEFHGRPVGSVEILVSRAEALRRQKRALFLTLGLMVGVALSVVAVIRLLLQLFLRRPLDELTAGLERIAQGAYDQPLPPAKWADLDRIVREVNHMAGQIAARDRALRESKERYEELANSLPEMVYEADAEGRFRFLNRSGFRLFGYAPGDMDRGLRVTDVFSEMDRERVRENLRRILAGAELGATEYTALRKDGSTFPVLVHSSPIVRDGHPVGLRGIAVDITGRKRREEELGKVAEGVAHRVRNPMTTVGGFARRLRKRLAGDEEARRWADIILEEASRLEQLVADIHRYTGLPRPEPRPVSLATAAARAVADRARRLAAAGIQVAEHYPERVPPVSADPALLRVVLDNLLHNAEQAMPHGGTLRVEVEAAGDRVCAAIQDTGEGIDPEDLPYVFDPFFSSRPRAAGLGLTVARRIVWEHKGEITVESTAGAGTRVQVCFPALPAPPATSPSPP